MERLTKKYAGGYGLTKVKDNEQDVESKYPNTLKAILECFEKLGIIEDAAEREHFRLEQHPTNFDQITASPEALATFLGSLSVSANDPWDDAFQRAFCDGCPAEDCDAAPCPHQEERDNPAWWLAQEVQA